MKERIASELAQKVAGDSHGSIGKKRVYVNDPSEVPAGYELQEGERGGLYYVTEGTSEGQARLGGHEPSADPTRGTGAEEQDERAVRVQEIIEATEDSNYEETAVEVEKYVSEQVGPDVDYPILNTKEDLANWASSLFKAEDSGMLESVSYISRFEDEEEEEGAVGKFDPDTQGIELGRTISRKNTERMYQSNNLAGSTTEHVILHEIAHALHHKNFDNPDEGWEEALQPIGNLDSVSSQYDTNLKIKKEVSNYAKVNKAELVAEVFAATIRGVEFSEEIIEHYQSANGPDLQKWANQYLGEDDAPDIPDTQGFEWSAKTEEEFGLEEALEQIPDDIPDALADEARLMAFDVFGDDLDTKGRLAQELAEKARRYVDNPEDAPEGVEVQTGPQDGLYYETEGEDGAASQQDGQVSIDTAEEVKEYVESFLPQPSIVGANESRAKIGDGISSDWIEFEKNTSTEALQNYFDREVEEFQDNPLSSVADEIKENYSLRMIGGILLSREDGNVNLDDVIEVYGESVVDEDKGEISKNELMKRTEQVASSLNPVVSGSLFANIDRIEHAQEPIPGDARFRDMGTEGEYDGQKRVIEFNTFTTQSPAPVAHELGHALHYLMGINYASNTKNIKFGDREVRPPEEWEAGWDVRDDAGDVEKQFFQDIDKEWDKFVEYYTKGFSKGCEPLWYYQKANGHEFFAIAFAFWVGDREKLEEYQPGVASIFDDYFGDSE